jgi:hypothetical protein
LKARSVLITSGLAGAILGVGISWAGFGHSPPLDPAHRAAPVTGQQAPQVVVDKLIHDFGLIDRNDTVRHAFRFTNAGRGSLTLKPGTTSCSACTIAEITRPEVAPGETSEIVVEYSAKRAKPVFEQYVIILTNDPEHPRVELKIQGRVTTRFRLLPEALVLSNVSPGKPTTAEVKILCHLSDDLRVVGHKFDEGETAAYFEATSETIPKDELKDGATSGCRVLVTVKPGLPLGPFRQALHVTVEMGDEGKRDQFDVGIEGEVVSDLSIVGPGWRSENGVLDLGTSESAKGLTRRLNVLVRGDARREVRIEPIKVEPSWLRVSLGEPAELNAAVVRIPLDVEIPPGRPPAIFIGTDQWKLGEIILGVKNHPDAKEIKMHVKFVIRNGK